MKVLTFGEIMLRLKAPGHERFIHTEGEASFWHDTQPACVRKARAAEPKPKGKGLFEC